MKSLFGLGLIALALLSAAAAQPAAPSSSDLNGVWSVDLSTDPGAPYAKPMRLALLADGTVTGAFYESTIEAGRWKTDRGRTCLSFRTTDGVGPYHSAACLVGDQIQGQTWAEHRSFLFNWNAVRTQ